MDTRVPVLLVTGFLGSGKTTFINWILKQSPDTPISLILNEFGDIQLESQLLEVRPIGTVAELPNGCMCCVASDDIPRVIKYILENAPQTTQIIIEASGLSDPDPVALALQEGELSRLIRLDTIVAIVDGLNFKEHQQKYPIVMSQIADADIVLLSKLSELAEESKTDLVSFVRGLGVGTRVVEWNDSLSTSLFLDSKSFDPTKSRGDAGKSHDDHDHHDHFHDQVDEVWIAIAESRSLPFFQSALRSLPSSVIRAKGILNVDGQKHLLQVVGNRTQLIPVDWTEKDDKQSHILILGIGLEEAELRGKFG